MRPPLERATSPLPNTVTLPAPAKLNLFLRILGRHPDGYHDLDTVIVPLDLADAVEVHAASDPGQFRTLALSLQVEGEERWTRGVPVDESNLALRAAKALADRVGVRGFADIRLEKRVPPAGGLGGGSSDAAATLRALNALWGASLEAGELRGVAAAVGSDVPALLERRPVRARGRGDVLEPVEVTSFSVALVAFSFGVSTAQAYAWWDEDGAEPGPEPERILEGFRLDLSPVAASALFNDLEAPVMRRHPIIREAKEALLEAGCTAAILCGSGPTVAGLLPSGRRKLDPTEEAELVRIAGSEPIYSATWERADS